MVHSNIDKILSYLHSIFIVILAFLAPIHQLMLLTGILLVIDFVTGIWASKKRKKRITSKRMRESVPKLIAYQLLLITAFIVQEYFATDLGLPFVKICATLLGLTELKSVAENLRYITKVNVIKILTGKVKEALKNA